MNQSKTQVEQHHIALKAHLKKIQRVQYLKINPYIFGKLKYNKTFNTYYNVYKYGLCIITAIFVLISLLFVSRWQANALVNLNLATVTSHGFVANLGTKAFNELGVNHWTNVNITAQTFSILIIISFFNIFMLLYTLVFKNGTAFSIGFMFVLTILIIVVMVYFFMAYTDPTLMQAVKMYKHFVAVLDKKLDTTPIKMQQATFNNMVHLFDIKLGMLIGYSVKMS